MAEYEDAFKKVILEDFLTHLYLNRHSCIVSGSEWWIELKSDLLNLVFRSFNEWRKKKKKPSCLFSTHIYTVAQVK